MKYQKQTIGSILQIHVNNEYYVYAQILSHGNQAYFDYRTKEPLKSFEVLEHAPVLFISCVYSYVITKCYWLKVGKMPVRDEFQTLPDKFIFDRMTHKFLLYDPNTGEMRPCTKEDARGKERAATWDEKQMEDRIRDHYNGVPCKWIEYELFD